MRAKYVQKQQRNKCEYVRTINAIPKPLGIK